MSRSERKRAWAAHERAKARLHKHVCEWCPADDIFTCTKAPCQHLKKKPCPSHKWNAKKGLAPERLDFNPPPITVYIGEYADFVPLSAKIAAEEMGKKMAATLNNMIEDDLIEDADGAPYPAEYQGKGFTVEQIEKMMEAGQDATGYASYKDFI